MRIGHGSVVLDIADDLPVIVADLQAPPVARIIDVSDLLPVRVHDIGARGAGRAGLGAIVLKLEAPGVCRCGSGDQVHGQDVRRHSWAQARGERGAACLLVVAHHNLFQLAHRFDRFARPIAAIL